MQLTGHAAPLPASLGSCRVPHSNVPRRWLTFLPLLPSGLQAFLVNAPTWSGVIWKVGRELPAGSCSVACAGARPAMQLQWVYIDCAGCKPPLAMAGFLQCCSVLLRSGRVCPDPAGAGAGGGHPAPHPRAADAVHPQAAGRGGRGAAAGERLGRRQLQLRAPEIGHA